MQAYWYPKFYHEILCDDARGELVLVNLEDIDADVVVVELVVTQSDVYVDGHELSVFQKKLLVNLLNIYY